MSRSTPTADPAGARKLEELRRYALGFPEAWEDHPWGHVAIKVRKKAFVFMGVGEEGLSLSAKLPQSHREAKLLPFAEATGYGLGKSGWVSARFPRGGSVPLGVLCAWIDESYRAIAPKKLIAQIGAAPEEGPAAPEKRGVRGEPSAKKAGNKTGGTKRGLRKKA